MSDELKPCVMSSCAAKWCEDDDHKCQRVVCATCKGMFEFDVPDGDDNDLDSRRVAVADIWNRRARHIASAPSEAFRICDAYESGIGHGLQRDGMHEGPFGDIECAEAYQIGYGLGLERAQPVAPVAPAEPLSKILTWQQRQSNAGTNCNDSRYMQMEIDELRAILVEQSKRSGK